MKDTESFKKEREEKFGGEIRYMTYVTFIGEASSDKVVNRGGIIFLINDTLHYEDFEKMGGLMVLFNQKEDYSKTEFSVALSDISIVKEIREKNALNCILGLTDENEILPAPGGIFAIFSKSVIQLIVNNRPSLFLDFLDKEGFLKLVNEFMLKTH